MASLLRWSKSFTEYAAFNFSRICWEAPASARDYRRINIYIVKLANIDQYCQRTDKVDMCQGHLIWKITITL